MYSRLSSDEQAVKAWFRHYSSGLASVGIRLGLTPPQQSELEHRLLAVCQDSDTATATKDASDPTPWSDRRMDPIKSRWLDDHVSVQGDTRTGA